MTDSRPPRENRDAMDAGLRARMVEFYRRADAVIAAHRPVCINRGACCRFAEYKHRLFVTPPELAYFLDRQRAAGLRRAETDAVCPYQIGGVCTAREHRPLGCRIFFCDPATTVWQGPEYERCLAELKAIGDELQMPYRYVEWLQALRDAESQP